MKGKEHLRKRVSQRGGKEMAWKEWDGREIRHETKWTRRNKQFHLRPMARHGYVTVRLAVSFRILLLDQLVLSLGLSYT